MQKRLHDLGEFRLKEMDEAGIDLQVVSHGAPATQRIDAETAVPLAKRANDRLFEAIKKHPGRLEGFAVLPTANPKAAEAMGDAGYQRVRGITWDDAIDTLVAAAQR
jgi:2,3-dihydroxybenzoate decarboxylase